MKNHTKTRWMQLIGAGLALLGAAMMIEASFNTGLELSAGLIILVCWGTALLALMFLSAVLVSVLFARFCAQGGTAGKAFIAVLAVISAISLLMLFTDESLHPYQVFGMALMVVGLTALGGKSWPRLERIFNDYHKQIKMMPHM